MYTPSWLGNIFIFRVLRLQENAFVKLPRSWHDLIINVPYKTAPHKIAPKTCPPICHEKIFLEKGSPILYGGDTMTLLHWKIMCGDVLPQYLRGSGFKLVKISNWAKLKLIWQNRLVGHYIRIGMLSVKTLLVLHQDLAFSWSSFLLSS